MDRTPVLNNSAQPKRPSLPLKLPDIPQSTFTTQFAGMSTSPTSARRRATLTPYQAWLHASGSFSPPEPHVHEDWIYCGTETIPEHSSCGSTPTSKVATPSESHCISAAAADCDPHTSATPGHSSSPPSYPHSRSNSVIGVHYSTAYRRVPSSPSFRSSAVLPTHGYFDRPPSPASSISSRSSEPLMIAHLSLSEIMVSTSGPSVGDRALDDDPSRREMQREERKLAMRERHAAIRERREKEKWAKVQARC